MERPHGPHASVWKWTALLGGALLPALLGGGCESMSNTDKGLLAGGGLGAVTGLLAGGPRHAGAGAAIGTVVGAAAGGLTGAAIDKSERKQEARVAAAVAAQRPPLSIQDVQLLTANGSSDALIIEQIRTTGSVYHLSADEIIWLQNNGVREPVIREMQATASRTPARVYTAAPVVQPVYVVEPGPPPPAVGIGFSYGRRW
jgi:hypothetical protein